MKNKILKYTGIATTLGTLGTAFATHAAYDSSAFSTTTVVSNSNAMLGDIGLVIGGSIVAILTLSVALLGLGWAYRHLKSKITGRKF